MPLEVTLSVLGFTDINTPTIGVLIYWANEHTALVAGIWWWIFFPVLLVVVTFIGLFLLAVSIERVHRPAQPPRQDRRMSETASSPCRACAPTTGRPRSESSARSAPSTISASGSPNEIYGLAGE